MNEENLSRVASAVSQSPLDLTKYTLSSPAEIIAHLNSIVAHRNMATVFSNQGKTFILTRFLAVNAEQNTLIFDWASERAVNQQILGSERNVFVCSPEGVKTQFITGRASQVEYEGQPAFVVSLPEQIIKLQRREFFRIRTPLGKPATCRVAMHPDELELEVFDISLGGASLRLPTIDTPGFELGQRYGCILELETYGTLAVTLEVRHRLLIHLRNGQDVMRIGCRFVNLPVSMETLIQRYVGQLEFDRRLTMR